METVAEYCARTGITEEHYYWLKSSTEQPERSYYQEPLKNRRQRRAEAAKERHNAS